MNASKAFFKKIVISFLHTVRLQLLFSLIWLPLSAYWGLTWPLLSCAGNIIFGPVATLFLWLSSLLFFSTLLGFPPLFISYILNYFTAAWFFVLKYAPARSVYAHTQPSLGMLIILLIILLILVQCRPLRTLPRQLGIFSFLCIAMLLYLNYPYRTQLMQKTVIEYQKSSLQLFYKKNSLLIIDKGALGRPGSGPSALEYTLLPALYKKYGSTSVDHLILLHCNLTTLKAVSFLVTVLSIKNIYLPYWQGDDIKVSRAFKELSTVIAKTTTRLIRLGTRPLTISLTPDCLFTLVPENKWIKKGAISIPQYTLQYPTELRS